MDLNPEFPLRVFCFYNARPLHANIFLKSIVFKQLQNRSKRYTAPQQRSYDATHYFSSIVFVLKFVCPYDARRAPKGSCVHSRRRRLIARFRPRFAAAYSLPSCLVLPVWKYGPMQLTQKK